MESPDAKLIKIIHCACRSVGNPGYSLVSILQALIFSPSEFIIIEFLSILMSIPAFSNKIITLLIWLGSTFFSVTSPPVAAIAIKKVPASMRSGITSIASTPPKLSTPWIFKVLVPIPDILAPISFNNRHSCWISGSAAALWISVMPLANTAAINTLPVAPTETFGNTILFPIIFSDFATTYPASKLISIPNFFMPSIWKSTGLGPQAQPPGNDTFASPNFAISGPSI